MQGLKAAMAVFCTACICAELVAQITESGWARRGIKVVAGLYILAAALHLLPQLKAEGDVFSIPTVSSVELGTWEQAALAQTQTQLEQDLEERFGGRLASLPGSRLPCVPHRIALRSIPLR